MTQIVQVQKSELNELQTIGEKTFKESFGAQNSLENMDHYLRQAFSASQIEKELDHPQSEFYFARTSDQIVGYLKINFGVAQTVLTGDDALEIERIYVLQQSQGNGIGQQLFDQALKRARFLKVAYVWLGVWEQNVDAIRFYERNGFAIYDSHSFMLGDDEQTDYMMKLVIS